MKVKILLTGMLLTCLSMTVQAQTIQSLTVIPSNPTPFDTITILAECVFPSGGCALYTQNVSVVGQDIYAGALHCLDALTVICNYTDTIIINPLQAGNYTFHFQLDAGFGPEPCTPGIVPGPSDSVSFIVAPTVGLQEYIYQDEVAVFPNPFGNSFEITGIDSQNFPVLMEVFSVEGKLVKAVTVNSPSSTVHVSDLPAAVYQLRLTKNSGEQIILQGVKN